jgi:hypothetical protein
MWPKGDTVNGSIRKLYSMNEIGLAALIGGPLAGFYLIGRNYMALEKKYLSRINFIFGIIGTILLGTAIVFIPKDLMDKIPDMIIPALFAPLVYVYVKKVQGQDIEDHFKNGGLKHSLRDAVGIGVFALMITLVSFFAAGKMAGSVNVSTP